MDVAYCNENIDNAKLFVIFCFIYFNRPTFFMVCQKNMIFYGNLVLVCIICMYYTGTVQRVVKEFKLKSAMANIIVKLKTNVYI